ARSGRAALKHQIAGMGQKITDAQLDSIYEAFLTLADKKKEVALEDLAALVQEELFKVPELYKLEHIQFLSGSDATPMAALRIRKDKEVLSEAATGNGPVDAAYQCIERIVGRKFELIDWGLNAITSGEDAVGEARVRIRFKDTIVAGTATSTDVIEASVKAYLAAINRYIALESREKAAKKVKGAPRKKTPAGRGV
ncbi:MAG TPA: alpha-isopropylmalate synthase regulatory domain-containing protein, partial [Candidatus Deferrimicrobiaceae bacterium]